MREPKSMMQKCQHENMTNGGISFTEEGFTQLYNECLDDLDTMWTYGKISGAIIGGMTVGFIGLGVYGFNKLKNNKSKDDITKED